MSKEIALKVSLAEVLNTACPFATLVTYKAMGGKEELSGPPMSETVEAAERRAAYNVEG